MIAGFILAALAVGLFVWALRHGRPARPESRLVASAIGCAQAARSGGRR